MSTSKLQQRVSKLLSIHLGQYTIRENIRPDWLITPKGTRLELDFYIEELQTAIEVQGAQHYIYTPHFHGDENGFTAQLKRDAAKAKACHQHGVRLIEIDTYDGAFQVVLQLARKNYEAPMHPNAIEQALTIYIDVSPTGRIGGPRTIRKHIKQIRKILRKANGQSLVSEDKNKINRHLRAIEQYEKAKFCQK